MINRICPYCGSSLKEKAISCPSCGSDENTGWSDNSIVDWDLPDYEEIVQNEFKHNRKKSLKLIAISIVLLIVISLSLILAI